MKVLFLVSAISVCTFGCGSHKIGKYSKTVSRKTVLNILCEHKCRWSQTVGNWTYIVYDDLSARFSERFLEALCRILKICCTFLFQSCRFSSKLPPKIWQTNRYVLTGFELKNIVTKCAWPGILKKFRITLFHFAFRIWRQAEDDEDRYEENLYRKHFRVHKRCRNVDKQSV